MKYKHLLNLDITSIKQTGGTKIFPMYLFLADVCMIMMVVPVHLKLVRNLVLPRFLDYETFDIVLLMVVFNASASCG